MKVDLLLVAAAVALPSLIHAESLGRAAEREQERRQKIEAQGIAVPKFEGVGLPEPPKPENKTEEKKDAAPSLVLTGGRRVPVPAIDEATRERAVNEGREAMWRMRAKSARDRV